MWEKVWSFLSLRAILFTLSQGGQKFFEDAEEKALFRLGVTYGTLRRLGFSEDRVDECLRNMDGLDTEDAFTWVRDACLIALEHLRIYLSFSFICVAQKMNLFSVRIAMVSIQVSSYNTTPVRKTRRPEIACLETRCRHNRSTASQPSFNATPSAWFSITHKTTRRSSRYPRNIKKRENAGTCRSDRYRERQEGE